MSCMAPTCRHFLIRQLVIWAWLTGLGTIHSLYHCYDSWFLFLSLICVSKHDFIALHLIVPDRPLHKATALRLVPSGPPSINISLDKQEAIKPFGKVFCSEDANGLSSCYKITVTESNKSFKHLTHIWTATQHWCGISSVSSCLFVIGVLLKLGSIKSFQLADQLWKAHWC